MRAPDKFDRRVKGDRIDWHPEADLVHAGHFETLCRKIQPGCARRQGSKAGPGAKVFPSLLLINNKHLSNISYFSSRIKRCLYVKLCSFTFSFDIVVENIWCKNSNVQQYKCNTRFLVQNMLMVEHCIGRPHHLGSYLCCLCFITRSPPVSSSSILWSFFTAFSSIQIECRSIDSPFTGDSNANCWNS